LLVLGVSTEDEKRVTGNSGKGDGGLTDETKTIPGPFRLTYNVCTSASYVRFFIGHNYELCTVLD